MFLCNFTKELSRKSHDHHTRICIVIVLDEEAYFMNTSINISLKVSNSSLFSFNNTLQTMEQLLEQVSQHVTVISKIVGIN